MAILQFPSLIGEGFKDEKSPEWSTQIATSVSGRVRARKIWSYPVWHFKIKYEVLRDFTNAQDLDTLLAFFNSICGRYAEFAYTDAEEHLLTDAPVGVGDGSTKIFQLSRTVTSGGNSWTEPVYYTNAVTNIKVNGTTQSIGTQVSVGSYGLITFTTAPANGALITWTGDWAFLCRMSNDKLGVNQLMKGLWAGGVQFETVKR